MTDREKQLIDNYIPSPRDETLGDFEYYIADDNFRIQKVYIVGIYPGEIDGAMEYGVRFSSNGNRYCGWKGYGHTQMHELYDNKEDCRNQTHVLYDGWERLRRLQEAAE